MSFWGNYICYFYSVSLTLISIRQFLNKNLNEIKKIRNISKIQLKFRENGLVIAKKYTILKGRSKIFKWILQNNVNENFAKRNQNFSFRLLFCCLNEIFVKEIERYFGNPSMYTNLNILNFIFWKSIDLI